MPKCCIHAPAAVHNDSLTIDAQAFSAWVGGMWPPLTRPPLSPPMPGLTSALHVDLKLWQPSKKLGRSPRINDAEGNALKVARPQLTKTAPQWDTNDYRTIFGENGPIAFKTPKTSKSCAIIDYDTWLLEKIRDLRNWARGLPAFPGAAPSFLTTIGMAQKSLNVYIKYMACWAYAGKFHRPPAAFIAPIDPIGLSNFVCALHCPLDNFLLGALSETDIGKYLIKNQLLRATRTKQGWTCKIRQEDGDWRPWSKLDCPTAYYALQWFIRRIAMATWPSGCSAKCINPSGGIDPEGILKGIFPDAPTRSSKWWEKLNACPDEKFQNSAIQTIQNQITSASAIVTPSSQMHPESNALGDIPRNPMPNALAGNRPCIKIKGNAKKYWGLRLECDTNNNYWGCVYQTGTLAIKIPTRVVLRLAHVPGVNPLGHPWATTPLSAYVAQRTFPTPDEAFKFLAIYFDLCACDQQAINKLKKFGVNWILRCNLK